ncbi:MAG: hypothetical protein H6721_28865 [Sandaracinus sp.]|nr:hypothetical protein [Sandaracinus sp.]
MRFLSCLVLLCVACGDDDRPPARDGGFDAAGFDADVIDAEVVDGEVVDAPRPPIDAPLDPDAACAAASSMASVERLPVDIVWMIDNSSSMEPAIEEVQRGLNAFATLVAGRDLDYRVIMLSLRGVGSTSLGGSTRYQVCIPPPLAGDSSCGDGTRFFHRSVDVRSTQLFEQFLGTLGQTSGYAEGQSRGSPPWRDLLRPEATKTLVFVSDDDSRLAPDSFERFPGGSNPFNSNTLPPGILDASWSGLFEDYVFSGIYGWGSTADPSTRCTFSDGSMPSSAGPNYSTLVLRTGGVRAQICDGPAAWSPFFDAVATAVDRTSRVDCALEIPPPPDGGFFDPMRINVFVREGETSTRIGRVSGPGACDPTRGGWHYDDEGAPTRVVLCPVSCEQVQPSAGVDRGVEVQFGCQSVPI